MTISSSLNASVAGLAANATRLAGISDNIANSGTNGYKRVSTEFDSMVINQARGAGIYSAGGVRATASRLIDEKGALVSSSNALDLAVSGRGFLPVMPSAMMGSGLGSTPMMMTSTGSFRPDADGVLRTQSGLVLMGWPANSDGRIPVNSRDSVGGLQPVVLNMSQTSANPTTTMSLNINLPAADTKQGAAATSWPTKAEYFGNLGSSESLDITFVPVPSTQAGQMSNTWRMEIRDSASPAGSNLVGSYQLVFDDSKERGGRLASVTRLSGGAYDANDGTLSLTVAGGPMTVRIGRPNDQNGLTQLDSAFKPTVSKDGSPAGSVTAVEVDENGMMKATYDTGFVRTLYQIPLVDVPNPNGLLSLNNQAYQISPSSGSFFLWDAGDGPTSSIMGYALEGSTTDVAAELTDLIQTQRAYSSNAKVIQTVDEMLQETTNIKR